MNPNGIQAGSVIEVGDVLATVVEIMADGVLKTDVDFKKQIFAKDFTPIKVMSMPGSTCVACEG